MIGNLHAILFKYVDVVEDHVALVNADGHDILVAVRSGAQVLQTGQGTGADGGIVPYLVKVEQKAGGQVGFDLLAGVRLEGFRLLPAC